MPRTQTERLRALCDVGGVMKRTALKRHTPMRRVRATPRNRKTVVRLTGQELKHLRLACFVRDRGICQDCFRPTYFDRRYDCDPEAYEMAHITSRGASGSDTLENVRVLCGRCHRREHAGLKPEGL